jgi:hypothetical protein
MSETAKWKPSLLAIVLLTLQGIWLILVASFVVFDPYGDSLSAEGPETEADSYLDVATFAWLTIGIIASASLLARQSWGWWFESAFLLSCAVIRFNEFTSGAAAIDSIPVIVLGLAGGAYSAWRAFDLRSAKKHN